MAVSRTVHLAKSLNSYFFNSTPSPLVKYGVRSPKFIWAPCAQLYSSTETPHNPPFGLIYEGVIVSQARLYLFVTPWPSQSIQRARLSVKSSELGSPTPSPAREGCSPPFGSRGGGGAHSLAGERGDPIPTKGQTLWYSMYTMIPLRITYYSSCGGSFRTL